MSDYYNLLGVSRDAGTNEIKKAYRKLALEYHPDRNKGSKDAEERFKEVTQAYEVLKDSEKRAAYDRYGEQGLRGGRAGASGFDFSDAIEVFMRDFGGVGGLEDLFGMSGARARRSSAQKGQTVRIRMSITLLEVCRGVTKSVRVALLDNCHECDGTGAERGTAPVTCSLCDGSGEERLVQRSVCGQFVSVQPCRSCHGEGRVVERACSTCHGEGRLRSEKDIEVEVPAGVTEENFLTLRGRGSIGPRSGTRGDVVVLLEVEDDPRFVRDGPNLLHELPITFAQASLGAEVDVPTIDGTARVVIPPGIQSGELIKLSGLGVPELNSSSRGDQLIRVLVWTPDELTSDQERLLRSLLEVESPPPEKIRRGSHKGFWSRVKEAFTGG